MSDSQAYEEVTAAEDGVTVVKRFEEDEFPVPAIAFEFDSEREESVSVRLSDTVPEEIEVEDLGFHPEYGSEFWTIDDETITFEREIEAGGSYTTVYGIRATGSDNVEQFLTEPEIETVDLSREDDQDEPEDDVPGSDDGVIRDAIAGEDEIPGLETEADEEEGVTLELNDPNSEQVEGPAAEEVVPETGSLAGRLAEEIREQDVSGEDLELLRRALDVAAENDGVNEARIEQLQQDIADLRAYTGALEEFLDENGTGEELIGEFRTELESFDDRLQSVQSEIDSNGDQLEAVSEQVSRVDDEMDSVGEELDGIAASVEELETEIETVEEQITDTDVEQQVEEIRTDIEELRTWQEQIKEAFGN